MSDEKELRQLVLLSTWSLEEAAHLVHSVNPLKNPVDLEETSGAPVSITFFWLKKEFGKDRLFRIGGDDATPRFSPGTIMRHLKEKGHHVSGRVWRMYNAAHARIGKSSIIPDSRKVYMDAAELIWAEYPNRTASAVAKDLARLPQEFSKNKLDWVSPETIRKWLTGLGRGKKGRPKGGQSQDAGEPDIVRIAQILDE